MGYEIEFRCGLLVFLRVYAYGMLFLVNDYCCFIEEGLCEDKSIRHKSDFNIIFLKVLY